MGRLAEKTWLRDEARSLSKTNFGRGLSRLFARSLGSLLFPFHSLDPLLSIEIAMKTACTFTMVALVSFVGCNQPGDDSSLPEVSDSPVVMDDMPPMMDEHSHPEHGPHGGELVELGKEAFHAELLHSDKGTDLYVLDGGATQAVPIAAPKLVVSLKHDGEVKSFDLAANPDADDTPGKSSRYSSADPVLSKWLGAEAEGAVVIDIDGKSFTGKIAHDHDHDHDHDHEGHDHDHDGHDHDDHDHAH